MSPDLPPPPRAVDAPGSGRDGAMPRRRFLALAGAAVAAAAAGLTGLLRGWWSGGSPAARSDRLTDGEIAAVAALAAVVFPPEADAEAREVEDEIGRWARGRSTVGPHLHTYRDGLEALAAATAAAGHDVPFSRLSPEERESVLTSGLESDPGARLAALVDEVLDGIYSSAPGWRSLGYVTWPGAPSPPLEYTRPPGRAARRRPT